MLERRPLVATLHGSNERKDLSQSDATNMFIHSVFQETDEAKIVEFIRQHPFAAIVSLDGGRPIATHIPIEITKNSDGRFVLEGHVARANPQWKTLEETDEVLTIISGAHAYISPRWYDQPHSTVPTWSYMIVHAYGKVRLITDAAELGEHLVKMVERYEHETSYDLARVPAVTMEKLTRGVVGFKISVSRFEAAFKLNQSRNRQSYESIISKLEKQPDDNSRTIAEAMKERRSS